MSHSPAPALPRVPELLAPAGSLDAVRAAAPDGAAAVSLGAERFNARDDGAQLTQEDLAAASRIAHAGGARVYLTFNILLKQRELEAALVHLGACIDRGIDAAIVQDLGAVRLIRSLYPTLELHGSTQMTVHDPAGARVVRELGVSRVVLARENTVEDIAAIHAAVPDLGLESFIHGALCIAYSGQCYMSGMISDRSANRGSCAQSCRKDYLLADGTTGEELDRGYLISARDLAAHDHLAAIADAGVSCLKIEGRKKKPEYVATVTSTWRTFLDRLGRGIRTPPAPAEVRPLVQIFSRGFTGGMYGGRQGRDYVTRTQPDNRGAVLGVVTRTDATSLEVRVSDAIAAGDGLGFEHPDGATAGNSGFAVRQIRTLRSEGEGIVQSVTLPPGADPVPRGWIVVRSAQATLLTSARASWEDLAVPAEPRAPMDVTVEGADGSPLTVTFRTSSGAVTVASSVPLAPAQKRSLDEAQLGEQLGRLGGTPWVLRSLDRSRLPEGLFLPVSVLNDLRQEAVSRLLPVRDASMRDRLTERAACVGPAVVLSSPHAVIDTAPERGRLVVETWRLDDARVAAAHGADEVSLDLFLRHPTPPVSHVRALAGELADRGVSLRLRTPTIIRPAERRLVDKWLALGLPVTCGHLGLVAELGGQGQDVVADYAANVFNAHTADLVFGLGARRIVTSVELTTDEIADVVEPWQGRGFEVVVHGRPEGMTLEHCVLSAAFDRVPATCRDLCVQKHPHVELTDPAGYTFPVATDSACRNRLLHSRPVDGAEFLPALWRAGIRSYRLLFNVPGDPVERVTAWYRDALNRLAAGDGVGPGPGRTLASGYTRGHFARAV